MQQRKLAAIMSVNTVEEGPLPVILWPICAFRCMPAIRDCAGLIGKLKRIWAISRNVVPANFKGCPASACMRERQLWDDVSPTKRKVHQALY